MESLECRNALAKQVLSPKVQAKASAIYKIGCRHKNVIVMVANRSKTAA
jgi:hypothetical protein